MSAASNPARLTSIVAIDQKGAIGCRNALPWKLGTDMAFFRSSTLGHTVIMGRKTFESIGGIPLAGRKNIVLSHNWQLFSSTPDCQLAISILESLTLAAQNRSREVFVIGGAATYSEFASLVDRYLVTMVEHDTPDADAFLAQEICNELSDWEKVEIAKVRYSPDRDQFKFRVFEFTAPDAEERAITRQHMIASNLIWKQKAAVAKSSNKHTHSAVAQNAFAF